MNGRQLLVAVLALAVAVEAAAQAAASGSGAVYKATPPPPYGSSDSAAPVMSAPGRATAGDASAAGGAAPVAPGSGVEIISGGAGSSDGAAKVGRMPVLQ